jgi:hypothetical protein
LEDIAILAAEEVAFASCMFENRGSLAEVWIYPYADLLDESCEVSIKY